MSLSLFDANTWIGSWPFSFQTAHTARSLAEHLRRHGIGRALVSPLGAVFAPEPGPANRELLRATRKFSALLPVPVINPVLGNWREELAACAADSRVRAVRLLPAYHHYRLRHPAVRDLMAALAGYPLRLVVTARLIDERHEYHALNLKPVGSEEMETFLASRPATAVLVSGLTRPEALKLAPRHPELRVDLSFLEWHDTVRYLATRMSLDQVVFASNTPFLITGAAPAKLGTAGWPVRRLAGIAHGNLERFLAS